MRLLRISQLEEARGVEMATIREKNGRFEYRFSYTDAFGNTKRKSVSGSSESECIRKREEFLESIALSECKITSTTTMTEILEEKFKNDFAKRYIEESTYNMQLEILQIIKGSFLNMMPIVRISVDDIEGFLISINHYSESTIKKVYRQISMAMRTATQQDILERNPLVATDFKRPKSRKIEKEVNALTISEQLTFVETLREHKVPKGRNNYKNQLMIELLSGLRMGEINALTTECVDLTRGVIHVQSTVCRGIGYRSYIKEGTKSDEGVREVPIAPELIPYLEDALENAKVDGNPLGLLLYDHKRDDVISTKQVNDFFYRILDKAGIMRRGQHALRHTFATRCIEAGVPAVTLKKWLGHNDIHITLDTYTNVFSGLTNDSISKLDNHLVVRECAFEYYAA